MSKLGVDPFPNYR